MPAEFALDGHMRAFEEGAGEIGEFPEGHAAMPLGARLPGSGVALPGRFGRKRKDRDVGCLGGLSLDVAADETNSAFDPARHGHRTNVSAVPDEIDDGPVAFPLAEYRPI